MTVLRTILVLSSLTGCFFTKAEERAADTVEIPKTGRGSAAAAALIEKLGAPDTVQREDAEKQLMALGAQAVPALNSAVDSPNPEIAARAKKVLARLADADLRPSTYSSRLPDDSLLCIEVRDTGKTLTRFFSSPLGRFLSSAPMKGWLSGYRKGLLDTEIKVHDSLLALVGQLQGKALIAMASPQLIDVQDVDPPLLFLIEVANSQVAESLVRNLFEGMADPLKNKRNHGKFEIEEQTTAGTVFGKDRIIHGLTESALDSFLDLLQKPPAKPLEPEFNGLLAANPDADVVVRIARDGWDKLADALVMIDDDQLKLADTYGFGPGSVLEDALSIDSDGVHELIRIKTPEAKAARIFDILKRFQVQPRPAAQPSALDLIPFQAAFVLSVNGDIGKNAADIVTALRSLDMLVNGVPIHDDKAPEMKNDPTNPAAPPRPPKSQSRAADAITEGGGLDAEPKKDTPPKGNPVKRGPVEPERTAPHFDDLRKAGVNLQELLEQIDGPIYVALFPEKVDIARIVNPNAPNLPADPETVPMQTLVAMFVKDSKPLEDTLERATTGLKLRYKKQLLNGGIHYIDGEGDADDSPGFWIDGNYVAYGTSQDVLEFASGGVHDPGKRITARPAFRTYIGKGFDPVAVVNLFADSEQFLEMPYKMGQLDFDKDEKNPWPDYALAGKILRGSPIRVKLMQIPGGLQIEAHTPLSLLGVYQAIMIPLQEANLVQ